MVKSTFFLSLSLALTLSLLAFEKLPSEYQVVYGSPNAPIHVTEYFSLSCAKCIEGFRKDFPILKEAYIQNQQVHWRFHLNPADILTLQAMVCLEQLSPSEKRIFWEVVIDMMKTPEEGIAIMKIAMETLGKPTPKLGDPAYLKSTTSFKAAYRYLKQPGIIQDLPTVEINGKLYDEFPSRKFLEKQFSSLSSSKESP